MHFKELRKKKGFTQKNLAISIGVSQQYISKIENGKIDSLTSLKIQKLSKSLKIDEGELYKIIINGRK